MHNYYKIKVLYRPILQSNLLCLITLIRNVLSIMYQYTSIFQVFIVNGMTDLLVPLLCFCEYPWYHSVYSL